MMFKIKIQTHFAAAHQLRDYPGDCERMHGHNYGVDVVCLCDQLDPLGMGIDFKFLKAEVKKVIEQLDHYNLNEKPQFKDINPSAENIARWIYQTLKPLVSNDRVQLHEITVYETDTCSVTYSE